MARAVKASTEPRVVNARNERNFMNNANGHSTQERPLDERPACDVPIGSRAADGAPVKRFAHVRSLASTWLGQWKAALSGSPSSDLVAGLTVAAVALPLNVALAVACELPASAGLVAGAIGGGLAALFGGAPLQVSGPAAALASMVLMLNRDFGAAGVALASVFVGVASIGFGLLRAGRFAGKVPEAVLAGFTTGVGLKLLDQQIPELLGFGYRTSDIARMLHEPRWLHDVSWAALVCGLLVAFVIVALARFSRFPAAIVGIGLVTLISVYVGFDVKRVGELPSSFPSPTLPLVGDRWFALLLATLPLAFLAPVESLLSAKALDRLSGDRAKHEPNLELVGQGIANIGSGVMMGMPVTGVIVRSSVNVQSGGRSRLAALVHAVVLASAVLFLSKYIAHVPLAALAGLLCVIAVRLIEGKEFLKLLKSEPAHAVAFAVTALGAVSGHLMTGFVLGLVICGVKAFVARRRPENAAKASPAKTNLRAVVDEGSRLVPSQAKPPAHRPWLSNILDRGHRASTAYIHGKASVIGRVDMGEHVHVAAGTSVRADEGSPFFIGADTNVQDGVIIHALKDKRVRVGGEDWAVYIGEGVSVAHGAIVHGPCYVGDHSFVGFNAIVHDSVVGKGCFIGHAAVVVGVEIPSGRYVPNGAIVDTAEAVLRLPHATEMHAAFSEDVVQVNRGLVAAYRARDESGDLDVLVRDESSLPPSSNAAE